MNKIFLFLAPVFFLTIPAFAGDKSPESIPEYSIAENKADPTVPKGRVLLSFDFYGSETFMVAPDSVTFSCNGKQQVWKVDRSAPLNLAPGKYRFQFYYTPYYREIYTDSIRLEAGHRVKMNVFFQSGTYPVISDKPVIYVYPEKAEQVSIRLEPSGDFLFTYPQYKNGWSFTADPDGTIHMDGKEYSYLFWDAKTELRKKSVDPNSGYIVYRDSLVSFFEKQLGAMGLNPKETEDFITYWCPRMQANEYNYVHFYFNAACDTFATMNIQPKPDQVFRVYMVWSKAAAGQELQSQEIPSVKRNGFTVLEWGGSELPDYELLLK